MTRIVHTADWHLGARLIDCDRSEEHSAFLDWLLAQLVELRPDALVVAGDIFDGATPPQEALNLYYRFLARLARTASCRTLILGGNHDSPATLRAPRDILHALDIRVIASPPTDPAEAIFEFEHALICAIPFLRERDVRTAAPGQSADEVAAAIRAGVINYYGEIRRHALSLAGKRVLIATGHLTAVGSQLSPSERTIHIGNLGAVDATCFEGFAYAALGHIHRPQAVGAKEHVRYAGSPIPLSFAEVDVAKEIRVIDVAGSALAHRAIGIPTFRPLLRVKTEVARMATELVRHQRTTTGAFLPWIELTVSDGRAHPDLDRQVREVAAKLDLRVLKILTLASPTDNANLEIAPLAPSLSDLSPQEVFTERLRREAIEVDSPEGQALALTFTELLSHMEERDLADKTVTPPIP